MNCSIAQEAISARLDGEDSVVSLDLVDAHVRGCSECSAWTASVTRMHREIRIAEAEVVPDLTAGILAAIGADSGFERRASAAAGNLRICRFVLACCAALQLVATLPYLLGAGNGVVHLDRELGGWDVALAVGLFVAAARPARAWGMLPLVGAIVTTMLVTATIDVVSGNTTLNGESSHFIELIGLFFLWSVARLERQVSRPRVPAQPLTAR